MLFDKQGTWNLPAIFGVVGSALVLLPFFTDMSGWAVFGGLFFIILAFLANH